MLPFAIFLFPATAFGYIITGQIVDEASLKPIHKALIIGRNAADKVKVGIETDADGRFSSVDVKDSTLMVKVAKDGFVPIVMAVYGTTDVFLDLGIVRLRPAAVNLNEVTVTARHVIRKADRYIIIPTEKELKQASNGVSLLSNIQFKMPGMTVNESLQSITVDNITPVLKINGKATDIAHILTVNPDNILRIEYFDNPDIRYGNRQVIDIILKPRNDGGYVIGNFFSALNAGNINANIGANYHYKKSEFDLNYGVGWRDYNKRIRSSEESFIGGGNTIVRESIGQPCDFNYLSNVLSFGYTYMHDVNTVLSLNADISFENQDFDENSLNTEIADNGLKKYHRIICRTVDYTSPNFDLFFRKQIDKSQSLEVNAFARYSKGNLGRNSIDAYDDAQMDESINTTTQNTSWRIGAELMYSKTFSGNISANLGIKDFFNSTDNIQTNNTDQDKALIDQNRISVYAQLYGRFRRFNYSVNLAFQNNHSDNNSYKVNASRFNTNVNLNYAVSKSVSLNYLFMYDPSMPSSAQQSELIQTIDGLSVRQGNPNLKPSEYYRNRIYVKYDIRKFSSSLWVSHSRTNFPIYYAYSYIDNTACPYFGKFLSKPINGLHNDLLNLEWFVTVDHLFGHLTIWGKAGWDYFRANVMDNKHKKKYFYGSINGSFDWSNWLISVNYQITPRFYLSGNVFSSEDRWNTVKLQYRYKNWYFSMTGINLFTRRGSTNKEITVSETHPKTMVQCIKDNANMIAIGINYRLDFGKGKSKAKRTLNNAGLEHGVDVDY